MRRIEIIPSDFDSIKVYDSKGNFTEKFIDIYSDGNDCPIARAVKRKLNIEVVTVDYFGVCINSFEFNYPEEIGISKVAKVCDRALKNGKAYLNLGVDIYKL